MTGQPEPDRELELIQTILKALASSAKGVRIKVAAGDPERLDSVVWCIGQAARRGRLECRTLVGTNADGSYDVRGLAIDPVDEADNLAWRRWRQRLQLIEDYDHGRPWHSQ